MSKKLICFVSFILVMGLSAGARGDLVGHWRFDEGFGTTTVDSSGNNYDGTFVGDVQWSNDGVYGTCLQFSGGVAIRSYVEAAGSQEIEFGDTDISISVWIKTTATKEMTILTNVRNSGHHAIDMEQTPTLGVNRDDVHIGKVSYDNVFVTSIDSLATVNDGEWHHVALVQSHTFAETEGWTLYIDGNPDAKKSLDNSPDAGGQRVRIGGGVSHPSFSNSFIGLIDDIRIYDHALSEAEVMSLVIGESDFAFRQNPADGATDVPRDVVLSWMPGKYADKHDVYFGTNFDDVNDADRDYPLGVLVSRNQDANSYSPAELLQFGQTYYWRIDEVNAPPDYTLYKGDVWQFTAEPFAHPVPSENITATASSSSSATEGPENTVNGSGLDANDLHSVCGSVVQPGRSQPGSSMSSKRFINCMRRCWYGTIIPPLSLMSVSGSRMLSLSIRSMGPTGPHWVLLMSLPGRPVRLAMHTIPLLTLVVQQRNMSRLLLTATGVACFHNMVLVRFASYIYRSLQNSHSRSRGQQIWMWIM
jgi:hypothetical protein